MEQLVSELHTIQFDLISKLLISFDEYLKGLFLCCEFLSSDLSIACSEIKRLLNTASLTERQNLFKSGQCHGILSFAHSEDFLRQEVQSLAKRFIAQNTLSGKPSLLLFSTRDPCSKCRQKLLTIEYLFSIVLFFSTQQGKKSADIYLSTIGKETPIDLQFEPRFGLLF